MEISICLRSESQPLWACFSYFAHSLQESFQLLTQCPSHTRLPYPSTHGHTAGECCDCSIGLSPDTLLWLQHLPEDGSLHCSCIQPWSPLCTLCQTPFHSWGPQEAHRKELAEEKNVMSLSASRWCFWEHSFIFPLPWGPSRMIVKSNKRDKPHNKEENGKIISRGDGKRNFGRWNTDRNVSLG